MLTLRATVVRPQAVRRRSKVQQLRCWHGWRDESNGDRSLRKAGVCNGRMLERTPWSLRRVRERRPERFMDDVVQSLQSEPVRRMRVCTRQKHNVPADASYPRCSDEWGQHDTASDE